MNPQLVMLAGPNGAGKSTFYDLYLASSQLPFLNADAFAARTEVDSEQAARILDSIRDDMIQKRLGFITETVFSDPMGAKLGMLQKAIAFGFDVTLIYIGLASPELSGLRIDQRVAAGGHDVPRDRLASRFERSLANLRASVAVVPTVKVYDNSDPEKPYQRAAVFDRGELAWRAKKLPGWLKPVIAAFAKPPSPR
jgi:predicted ABC-type ATPase